MKKSDVRRKISGYFIRCKKTGKTVGFKRKWMFSVFGILAVLWILIRVIPKPSRATYPCMKVAFPFASSFLLYLAGITSAVLFFKKARIKLSQSKYYAGSLFLIIALTAGTVAILNNSNNAKAKDTATYDFVDPLGPNHPIGEAKGIFPGRVVWVHDPGATNESCDPDAYGDGYFLDKNCDQEVVDQMLSNALLALTGEETEAAAWDAVFHYFNSTHNRGNAGYDESETIFIKINAVHAWTTNADLSIMNDDSYGNVDTSPQAVLAMLKELIENAGVPQENIYIGDPFTNIFKHCYDKWSAEYPNVNYVSKNAYANRTLIVPADTGSIKYSDKGTVLNIEEHFFYDALVNADYLINIPAMKGHRWGGITFFAKNHFGSNTLGTSEHLHPGLHRTSYSAPLRDEYNQYRVMVDLMAHRHLGGKTLIYFGDMLWSTSYEHDPPAKFSTSPFNNDWSSSILLSLDPVAIASVSLDILQNEFQTEDLTTDPPRYTYVRFGAIDDYLHQAASSEWWPEDFIYSPNGDSVAIGSLGVHEHWNNADDKLYTRNLGTGDGIELVRIEHGIAATSGIQSDSKDISLYPVPANDNIQVSFNDDYLGIMRIIISDISGKQVYIHTGQKTTFNCNEIVSLQSIASGTYIMNIVCGNTIYVRSLIKQ